MRLEMCLDCQDSLLDWLLRKVHSQKRVWEILVKRDGKKCRRCGKKSSSQKGLFWGARRRLCIDHIVPKSKGGLNDLSNYQLLCHRCNSAKRDRLYVKKWRNQIQEVSQ